MNITMDELATMRKEVGVAQAAVNHFLGKDTGWLSRIERGHRDATKAEMKAIRHLYRAKMLVQSNGRKGETENP